jgi:hypothetical protein
LILTSDSAIDRKPADNPPDQVLSMMAAKKNMDELRISFVMFDRNRVAPIAAHTLIKGTP